MLFYYNTSYWLKLEWICKIIMLLAHNYKAIIKDLDSNKIKLKKVKS